MAATAATAIHTGPLDHLDVSLEDFEPSIAGSHHLHHRHPAFGYPSAHSGFRSDDAGSEMLEEEDEDLDSEASAGGYSPPAWRRLGNGDRSSGFWRKSDGLSGGLGGGGYRFDEGLSSRESSPEYESADEGEVLQRAMRTRLPGSESPKKERSPEPEFYPAHQFLDEVVARVKTQVKREEEERNILAETPPKAEQNCKRASVVPVDLWRLTGSADVRLAIRAEVQQRTEPIEMAVNCIRRVLNATMGSWSSVTLSTLVAMMAWAAMRSLFEPASMRPVPDLVKVAGVARSFEPLIYYSEHGMQQVHHLQATSSAVWDLGESVRGSNITSALYIAQQIDELSNNLNSVTTELIKFIANVNGDMDGILIVMHWARRELSQLQQMQPPPLAAVFDNVHNMLCQAGVLEDVTTGEPTRLGAIATTLFGPSTPQRTKRTLERTFHEFLGVLEEAVNNELHHSLALIANFEVIDHQFLNLARLVVHEASLQDERHDELLSSLWTRMLGARANELRKYERNRQLLQNVREKTVRNKLALVEHNNKLLALKTSLDDLRRKLASPPIRSVNGSTLTLDEQIRGLEDIGGYLEGVRARQKAKFMDNLYGSGDRGADRRFIDGNGFS